MHWFILLTLAFLGIFAATLFILFITWVALVLIGKTKDKVQNRGLNYKL